MVVLIAFLIGLLLGELIFRIISKIILSLFKIEFSKDEAYEIYRENKVLKLSTILRLIRNKAAECETSITFSGDEMGYNEESSKKIIEELRKRGFNIETDDRYDHWLGKRYVYYTVSWEK